MLESAAVLFLMKLLSVVAYPLGITILLLIVSVACIALNLRRHALFSIGAASSLLWVCSMPVFAAWALGTLERQFPARSIAEPPEAEVIIVLGGAIGQPVPPRVVPDLSGASDRVLHAARLFRAGKATRVLVSAGNLPWVDSVKPEAELIRELLVEWGVPRQAIGIAGTSRNTYENALEIKEIWRNSGFQSALLVTSAAHMPRALAVFRRTGLPVIAATTDVRIVKSSSASLLGWLPSADALAMTSQALKEWIGYWVYRAVAYL